MNEHWAIVMYILLLAAVILGTVLVVRSCAKRRQDIKHNATTVTLNPYDGVLTNGSHTRRIVRGLYNENTMERIPDVSPVYETINRQYTEAHPRSTFYDTAQSSNNVAYSTASSVNEWINPHVDYLEPENTVPARQSGVDNGESQYDMASHMIVGDTSSLGDEVVYEEAHPDLHVVTESPPAPPPRPSIRMCHVDPSLYDNAGSDNDSASGDEAASGDERGIVNCASASSGAIIDESASGGATEYLRVGDDSEDEPPLPVPPVSGSNGDDEHHDDPSTFYSDKDVYGESDDDIKRSYRVDDVYATVLTREQRARASNSGNGHDDTSRNPTNGDINNSHDDNNNITPVCYRE